MNTDPTWQYVVPMTAVSTIFLVFAIILILGRAAETEMKLILIGIFMAIAAAMQANVASAGVNGAQAAMIAGLGSATLTRISVILTLAGVGLLLMSRATPPAIAGTAKEPPHVD